MATLKSIRFEADGVEVTLSLIKEEYSAISSHDGSFILLPIRGRALNELLTTGKLGTGNRIMVPNRLLAKHGMDKLQKKVAARIFDFEDGKFLLIRLEGPRLVPKFEEDVYEKA